MRFLIVQLSMCIILSGCTESIDMDDEKKEGNQLEDAGADLSENNVDMSLQDAGEPTLCDDDTPCPDGSFCAHHSEPCQGAGVCQAVPLDNSGQYEPVCGCDGLTYGNLHTAQSRGVSVLKNGSCEPNSFQSCGGLYEAYYGGACETGSTCIHSEDDMCGWYDASGRCERRPDVCGDGAQPVCGCDEKTYVNECQARLIGAGILSRTACDE